jgi:hypothetical protein
MIVVWNIAPCSLVEVDGRFRDACSCRRVETMSLNCVQQQAYCWSPRWYGYGKPRWNDDDREKPNTVEKTCCSATLSTTNSKCPDPGANPGLCGERQATNRLSHGTTLQRGLLPPSSGLNVPEGRRHHSKEHIFTEVGSPSLLLTKDPLTRHEHPRMARSWQAVAYHSRGHDGPYLVWGVTAGRTKINSHQDHHWVQTSSGAYPASCPVGTRVKRLGRKADCSLSSNAEVNNKRS